MADRRRGPLVGLLAGTAVSALGTRMSAVALPWFVLVTTGSVTRTGLVAFAQMTPYVLVSAVGGPAVDRLGARQGAVAGNLAGGALVGSVPALHAAGRLGFGTLLALVAAAGAAWGLAASSERVLVPGAGALAGTPMERVAGLVDGLNRLALLLGAPLAAALLVVASAPVVLALDAVSFALCALVLGLTVPAAAEPEREPAEEAGNPVRAYLADLRAGFGWLRGQRLLLGIALMVFLTNLLDQAFVAVLLPAWVRERLGDPAVLGVLLTAFAAGAVASNALATWLGPRLPRHRTFAWGFLLAGGPHFLVLALAPPLPVLVAVTAVSGVAGSVLNPILGAVQYERVPRRLQARVLNAITALAWAGIPLGGLAAGWSAGAVGVTTTLVAVGVLYVLVTLAPFLFPAWKEMDRRPVQPAAVG